MFRGTSRAQPLAVERLGWKAARATCSGGRAWWSREAQSCPVQRHAAAAKTLSLGDLQGRQLAPWPGRMARVFMAKREC